MVFDRCPGSATAARPGLAVLHCPKCSAEVEMFADEEHAVCDNCGAVVSRERTPFCFDWCKYAKECLEKLQKQKG